MINKITSLLEGYLRIDIRGNALGRFIVRSVNWGILLWNMEYLSYDHVQGLYFIKMIIIN